ncbi:glycosyltransferase family 2 protein [Candidatus Roizmanbacteria bacterium]|nr:glycosyltransferase family 2 protein [Candidatus Roizmanbacteria bacterium]
MKISFIIVLYQTKASEIERLKNEIMEMKFSDYSIFWIDNSHNGHGYAQGVNEGVQKGMQSGADIFVICNPDISLKGISAKEFLQALAHFDLWGFAMKQEGVTYYGGALDTWKLSSLLLTQKPNKRFSEVTYVTGSCVAMKRNVVEAIGEWDTQYGMYYEDVDYSIRAKMNGFRIGIDADVCYTHFEVSQFNPYKKQQLRKAWKLFFRKYATPIQKIRELIVWPKTLHWSKSEL